MDIRRIVALSVFGFFIFCTVHSLFSDNNEEDTSSRSSEAVKEREEDVKTLFEERKEILAYGIESEVVELLKTLAEEENTKLSEDVYSLLTMSLGEDVNKAIFAYFTAIHYTEAWDKATGILKNHEDYGRDLLLEVIEYLSIFEDKAFAKHLYPLVDHSNDSIASKALKTIGLDQKSNKEKYIEDLLEKLDSDDFPSQLKPEILLALGSMKADAARQKLETIVLDENEESTWRRYAADALGKIGNPESLQVLNDAYETDDVYLRSYILYAIGQYDTAESKAFLLKGLRDSFWRSRVVAAKALGELQYSEAVPILVYKAKNDPENKVKIEAIQALGAIGNAKAVEELRDFYTSKKYSLEIRKSALLTLTNHHTESSVNVFKEIIQKEWGTNQSRPNILMETVKALSKQTSPALKEIFLLLLDHPHYIVTMLAIRGIQKNGFTELKGRIESLTEEGNSKPVRKTAADALESL